MSETWDDYVATDQTDLAEQVNDDVNSLATDVNADPGATEDAQLDVIDAQSSSYDAVTDSTTADGYNSQGDWEAQQAQSWSDYAEGAAAQGLDDLAENAANTAASYSGDAAESYESADSASADASSELADTAGSVADVSSSYDTTYDTSSIDTSAVDSSSYDTSSYDTSSYDTSSYDTSSADVSTDSAEY